MSSPLYESLGKTESNNSIIAQFKKFRESFSGDAKEQVQQMLNSGKVSQAQYNRAVQMANQLQKLMMK